jgi:hypothetical protein
MMVSGAWLIFLIGCAGGFCLEVLRWYKLRTSAHFPAYARKPSYWALTIAMIVIGGGLATLYGLGPTNAIEVANIGAAAPAIIGAFASGPHRAPRPAGDTKKFEGAAPPQRSRLREFLAFG